MSVSPYDAARSSAIVVARTDRGVLRVHGRDPVRMVHGLVSADVLSLEPGHAVYATLLTPKGRMVADLRIVRRPDDLLLEADAEAAANTLETFKRSVPPLFARAVDATGELSVLGLYGPAASRLVAAVTGSAELEPMEGDTGAADSTSNGTRSGDAMIARLEAVPVDDAAMARFGDADVILLRTDQAGAGGWDLVVASDRIGALRDALVTAGAVPGDLGTVEVLRVEAGRPRWGAELTNDVIPLEAGLKERAISTTKGCYTGQEVIIRILHRGHVNRHLRGLIPSQATPAARDELFHDEVRPGKPVGVITSAVTSPRSGGSVALGYVRREVEPGDTVHIGSPDGPTARVVELPFDLPR